MTIEEQIKECEKRRKEYNRLIKDIDLMKLAYLRSIATETMNITKLRKQLKEQNGKNNNQS